MVRHSLTASRYVPESKNHKCLILMPLAEQRGGAELALLHLLRDQHRSTVAWYVIFFEDGPMVVDARNCGVSAEVIEAGRLRQPLKFSSCVWRLVNRIGQIRADLVLSWMGKAQLYAAPASVLAGTPCAWFQHGSPRSWLDVVATRLPSAATLTCSRFVARAQAKLAPNSDVRVVYPGVELGLFDAANLPGVSDQRRQLGLPERGPVIGIAGRLQSWKGMHVLLDALPRVLRHLPDTRCLIVGGEHSLELGYAERLRRKVDELGLASHVTFAGFQQNVPEWMHAMDVVVHASHEEPFGMVVVEAMALGKPVIATAPGGPAEVITDGIDGQLVRSGDSTELADAIVRFLKQPDFAQRCAENAANRARDFSAASFAECVSNNVLNLIEVDARRTASRSGVAV